MSATQKLSTTSWIVMSVPAAILGLSLWASTAGTATAQPRELSLKCGAIEQKSRLSPLGVQVYQGFDGWFFRQGDLESLFELPDYAVQMLVNVDRALRYKGTHLILLPMVPKGLAAYDFVPNNGILSDMVYDVDLAEQQFDALVQELRATGIDVVNLNDALRNDQNFDKQNYYFKRDIHWRPAGAHLAADFVASHIEKLSSDAVGNVEYTVTETAQDRLRSGLHVILNELCQSAVPAETIQLYETKQVVGSLDDLLGEETSAETAFLHVVGSSFTAESNPFPFNDFLRSRLKQVVGGFSISGGGIDQSIYAWAQSPEGLAKKPKFAIWELPNLSDFIKQAPEMNASLVPAIVGSCAKDLKLAEKTFADVADVQFDLPEISGSASNYYLEYQFSNQALSNFELSYTYVDKTVKKVAFANPPRATGLSKLYQTLPGETKTPPIHVSLTIDNGMKSAGTVSLCRFPNEVNDQQVQN
jgi:hypothetical protein